MDLYRILEIFKIGLEVSDDNVTIAVSRLKILYNQRNVKDFFAIWAEASKNFRNLSRIHFRLGDQIVAEMYNYAKKE